MMFSSDNQLYKNYKNQVNNERKIIFLWQLIILVSFIALWEIASRMDWINPLIFSFPSEIFSILLNMFSNGKITSHLQITLFETVLGLLLGTIVGIIFATVLWSSSRLSRIMNPFLVVLYAMPKVAFAPIFIVAIGPDYVSAIAMSAIISATITTLVIYTAFLEVDPNYERVLKSFGANRRQVFREAVFPASLPAMLSIVKVNVGLSWVGVIVGEFLISKEGLGYLIIRGFQEFDFPLVISILVVIALCAVIMYKIAERLERWFIKNTN
ncbi:NitT/TauT family transport system permease protein [Virgibacillus subterraneus]|uniref:NitT/TauT family transport system permease protein n=1 Tax=Virgibacillus subterraneus TaxID=621109 RepID=A0A1H9C8P8_9BACI|nr:ABC transporter permease [Virgibacillus subterraneus]SEP97347.1 NitT/TauT family transport system permease protein [Virgibacillus subterraneus]